MGFCPYFVYLSQNYEVKIHKQKALYCSRPPAQQLDTRRINENSDSWIFTVYVRHIWCPSKLKQTKILIKCAPLVCV